MRCGSVQCPCIGGGLTPPYSCDVIYLDNNATTKPLAEVVESVRESLADNWGNPSSIHRLGQAARAQVESARESVARLAGCSAREIIFCSSGTESASLALRGVLDAYPKRRVIVTSKLEHAAVRTLAQHLEAAGRCEVIWAEHAPSGEIHLDHLRTVLKKRADEIALVSLMSVNNETGVMLPTKVVGELCKENDVLFHTDATQSMGRHSFDVANTPIDFATFSAHKLHGPKGVAALFARRGVGISAQLVGGSQERDRRAGTENVTGIVGFGVAAQAARTWLDTADMQHVAELRNQLETRIQSEIPDVVMNGFATTRIWNTTNIAFAHLEAEAILLALSNEGLCVSAGAACSSGSLDPTPVLLAMGVPPILAHGSVRFSLSRFTTLEEIAQAATIVCDCVRKLRARTSAAITSVK
jgi:cysteine desulfurase